MLVNKAAYQHPAPWDVTIETAVLPALLAQSAADHPDRALVRFMGREYSYRAMDDEARRFAAGLKACGIARGDRIGLFLPNVPAYVSAYYGAMMAGAVVVNFSPLYSVDELAHQVEDSGTRLLVTLDVAALLPTAVEVLDKSSLAQLAVVRLADQLPVLKGLALRIAGRRQLAKIPQRKDVSRWSDWLQVPDSGALSPELPSELTPDDLALLQYTGGTTGTPKGAMLTHANLSANARQVDAVDPAGRSDDDIVLGALPLFHVFANTCILNRTIARGGTIVMLPRFDAGQVLKAIRKERPTGFPGVPTMYQALLDHAGAGKTSFASLRVCISGGAPLPAPLQAQFEQQSGVRLIEGYGLTESAGVVCVNPYQGETKQGTIGQVLPGTQFLLLHPEDPATLAADGEAGELALRGPQIMGGYWNRPDTYEDTFAEHNGKTWLRTGDIARVDDEGYLKIVDRIKDMITVAGFKVFPSQVEGVLVEHPDVKEVLVIGVPDEYRGEVPRAYVSLNTATGADGGAIGGGLSDGGPIDGTALTQWLNARVGKHERVDEVVIREELPKTLIGKLDRKTLRQEVLPVSPA